MFNQDLYDVSNALDDVVFPSTNITVYVKPSGKSYIN